jgi:Zn-dependent metalloprotease
MQFHAGLRGRRPYALVARALAGGALGLTLMTMPATTRGQSAARPLHISAMSRDAALDWDRQIGRFTDAGTLRLAKSRPDTVMEGRTHDRFDQYYGTARVFGAQLVRQSDGAQAVSVFGTIHPDITIDATPALSMEQVRARAIEITGGQLLPDREPELLVLPREGGDSAPYVLVWQVQVATRGDVFGLFVDAKTGAEVQRITHIKTQSAVGTGRGAFGDEKKISVNRVGSAYFADDRLRPPTIVTLDMRGNLARTQNILDGFINAAQSDVASDTDNNWTDAPIVDAHVYLGWTYDYFFKRFGRRGLDNNDHPIRAIVHPVSRADIFQHLNDDEIIGTFYLNAFWCGECAGGVMMFGEGLPPNFTVDVGYFSSALDVVGHELTHGVTDFSSNLIYQGEPGALNEAFSDMMGVSVEFFFQPTRADWMLAEDIAIPEAGIARALDNPRSLGDPDHYSLRYTGPEDNGGVHINSTIASHAFYLAIQGGTNRTSGRSVQGVGFENREQIEKVFYRAFVFLMPPNATFAVARQATLQAATDLYGGSSPAFRAVSQAWDAVGVQ